MRWESHLHAKATCMSDGFFLMIARLMIQEEDKLRYHVVCGERRGEREEERDAAALEFQFELDYLIEPHQIWGNPPQSRGLRRI